MTQKILADMKIIQGLIVSLFSLILCLSFAVASAQSVVEQGAKPKVITEGYEFTEGPFWHPNGFLLFSDIPANTIYKWDPDGYGAQKLLKPSGHSNGITMDTKGRLIICQHDGMVSALNDTAIVVLASSFDGKRLNSPNDAAVKSDGTIYFTDPPFGVSEEEKELDINGVYRIAKDGSVELLYDKLSRPNGIVFSPDEKTLYVNDSSDGRILSFDVTTDGNVSLPTEFANVGEPDSTGAADGMVVDSQGRLYSTGPGGISVFSPEGEQVEKIALPAPATNLEWGREGAKELFISTPDAIYQLQMAVDGVARKDS